MSEFTGLECALLFPRIHNHEYYVFSTGTSFKAKYFSTRTAAEAAMYAYCNEHGIHIEETERDRHERKYSNHNGVRFYINRV